MNRDKKLLMAFQSFKQRVVVGYPLNLTEDKQDEYDIDIFLASPEYKELEVTEEMIRELPRYYLSQSGGVVTMEQSKVGAYIHIHDVMSLFVSNHPSNNSPL